MPTYQGSCHCGKVAFEFDGTIDNGLECNCSVCHRKGAIWYAIDDEHFRIMTGQADLTTYQFGTRMAKHYFCRCCGVSTFSNPRIAPERWVVNLRCVDGVDLVALKVHPFDGRNWEQAVRSLVSARNKGVS